VPPNLIFCKKMKTSLTKIIWNDWSAFFAFCAIPIMWIIHIGFPHFKNGASVPIEIGIALSVIAMLALVWRITRVQKLFVSGEETNGVVVAVIIVKDRGRLEYSYRVNEEIINGWSPVHKSKQVLSLQVGQKITVLYDRIHPVNSIVADLFIAK
jgi:hypothetical protein